MGHRGMGTAMLGTPRAQNPTEEGWFYLHCVPSIQDLHTLAAPQYVWNE